MKGWFYRYAEGFRERDQFELAAEKYRAILAEPPQGWGLEKEAVLGFADMMTYDVRTQAMEYSGRVASGYENAEALLEGYLTREEGFNDPDALIARGDNFMEWAEDEPARYEQARAAYVRALETGRVDQDAAWMRMMRYYIRTDRFDEVRALKNRFLADA